VWAKCVGWYHYWHHRWTCRFLQWAATARGWKSTAVTLVDPDNTSSSKDAYHLVAHLDMQLDLAAEALHIK